MSIYCTRGDCGTLIVTAQEDGEAYVFQPEDVLRFKVFCKKECASVIFQKEIVVGTEAEAVAIYLPGSLTKIGELINKPEDYWYEVELNPYTAPKTIVGYDEDGPKLFRLYPEGKDVPHEDGEDLPVEEVYDVVAEALERAKVTGLFDGEDGYTPVKGTDYFDGIDGEDGTDGEDGITPKKGVDYYTEQDKEEMAQRVLAALPIYTGETEVAE